MDWVKRKRHIKERELEGKPHKRVQASAHSSGSSKALEDDRTHTLKTAQLKSNVAQRLIIKKYGGDPVSDSDLSRMMQSTPKPTGQIIMEIRRHQKLRRVYHFGTLVHNLLSGKKKSLQQTKKKFMETHVYLHGHVSTLGKKHGRLKCGNEGVKHNISFLQRFAKHMAYLKIGLIQLSMV